MSTPEVSLESIKFNFNQDSADQDAFNIRKNASDTIVIPEWQRSSLPMHPEDSIAAYAMENTNGNIIKIQIQLSTNDPLINSIEVRAIDIERVERLEQYKMEGCFYWLLTKLGAKFFMAPIEPDYQVLGEVKKEEVYFLPTGLSQFETFELINTRIQNKGIGIHNIKWQWQWRLPDGEWTDLFTGSTSPYTYHKIYIVYRLPEAPWVQTPNDVATPWTEALNYACRWANGLKSLEEAAGRITENIYRLGPDILEYDCPGGGGSSYTYNYYYFDCTNFIRRLQGEFGNGRYVNCTDCATFVSTFANIIGCNLNQSRMGSSFDLNPALAIGSNIWQKPCGWNRFNYHEVAWTGLCDVEDHVYDACLAVDGDPDPTQAPHTFLLPINMRFGNSGEGDYRDRVAAPSGRINCNPLQTCLRRNIM